MNKQLNQEQKDLLFGTLLGDGYLQTDSGGKRWRYRAIHKAEHKDYIYHKYEILKDLCESEPSFGDYFDKRTNKTYSRYTFQTVQLECLKFYGDMFYVFDKTKDTFVKHVPNKVAPYLTERALAYLHMDDGSLKSKSNSNAMRISTQGFDPQELSRLITALETKYDIVPTRTPRYRKVTNPDGTTTKKYIGDELYIPEKESTKYIKVIQPYLVDCMKYKVSDRKRGSL